jgi:hypothetical protein
MREAGSQQKPVPDTPTVAAENARVERALEEYAAS